MSSGEVNLQRWVKNILKVHSGRQNIFCVCDKKSRTVTAGGFHFCRLNYSLLLFSLGSSFAECASAREPAFDIYGYLDLGPRYSDSFDSSRWSIDSRGSYLGLTGASDTGSVARVFFQLEYEIYPAGDNAENFQRNDVFLGVQTAVGVFRAGVMETPLRHLADPIDLFPDTLGDPSALWNGDLRTTNTLYYQAPELSSLPVLYKAELAIVLSHDNDNELVSAGKDGFSAALWFGDEKAGLAFAADQDIGDDVDSRQRIAGYWSVSGLRLGAALERESPVLKPSSRAKLVSCSVSMGDVYTLKAQYGKSDIRQRDEYLFSFGVDVLLAENLVIYTNLHDHRASDASDVQSLESGLRYTF